MAPSYKASVGMFAPPAWMTNLEEPSLNRQRIENQQVAIGDARAAQFDRERAFAESLAQSMQQQEAQGQPLDMQGMIDLGISNAMKTGAADQARQYLGLQNQLNNQALYEQSLTRPQVRSVPGVGLVQVDPNTGGTEVIMPARKTPSKPAKPSKAQELVSPDGKKVVVTSTEEYNRAFNQGFRPASKEDSGSLALSRILNAAADNMQGKTNKPDPIGANPQARAAELKSQGMSAQEIKAILEQEFPE